MERWRPFENGLYLEYFLIKALWHPLRTLGYGWSFLTGHFQTKVEMTLYRKLKVLRLMAAGRRARA